ncbi:tumor necrosis factor receptor superfamily member 6-like [Heptranchias perlo]|uniref:tumor necrosis factor receptor superfamily member 6-like n=1 Tax=Heptranchias perlo TaxID=212740 RepID=UPI00355A757B
MIKAMVLAVGVRRGLLLLLLALLNVKGANHSTSVENNAVQNDLPITNIMDSAHSDTRKWRFRRDILCRPGQYLSEPPARCCKRCAAGTYLKTQCTGDWESVCVPCPPGEFTASENHLTNCVRCRQCQEHDGQESKNNCNSTHDTQCTCMENFFCQTPSESCEQCIRCKKCNEKTEETSQPCTETEDTVCVAKGEKSGTTGVIVGVLLVVVAAIILGVIMYLKRSLLPCNRKSKPEDSKILALITENGQPQPQVPDDVPDIKLGDAHLDMIVEEIEPKRYHELGIKLGLTEPKLQQIEANYHNDIKRQGYAILYDWREAHGTKGAFPLLIDTIRKAGYVTTAENILGRIEPMMYAEEPITGATQLDMIENGKTAETPVA